MKIETNKHTKAGVAILIPYKIDLKTKGITREKEGPRNPTSGIYLKKPETLHQTDICIHVFTAVLFTILNIQNLCFIYKNMKKNG